jgi:hypothetical protein
VLSNERVPADMDCPPPRLLLGGEVHLTSSRADRRRPSFPASVMDGPTHSVVHQRDVTRTAWTVTQRFEAVSPLAAGGPAKVEEAS